MHQIIELNIRDTNMYESQRTYHSPEVMKEALGIRTVSKASIRKDERRIKKEVTLALTNKHSLNFVYIRDYGTDGLVKPNGGIVIAYRIPVAGGKIIEVATSVCSKRDIFDKVEGKYLAASNFNEGKKINMIVASGSHYSQYLRTLFEI